MEEKMLLKDIKMYVYTEEFNTFSGHDDVMDTRFDCCQFGETDQTVMLTVESMSMKLMATSVVVYKDLNTMTIFNEAGMLLTTDIGSGCISVDKVSDDKIGDVILLKYEEYGMEILSGNQAEDIKYPFYKTDVKEVQIGENKFAICDISVKFNVNDGWLKLARVNDASIYGIFGSIAYNTMKLGRLSGLFTNIDDIKYLLIDGLIYTNPRLTPDYLVVELIPKFEYMDNDDNTVSISYLELAERSVYILDEDAIFLYGETLYKNAKVVGEVNATKGILAVDSELDTALAFKFNHIVKNNTEVVRLVSSKKLAPYYTLDTFNSMVTKLNKIKKDFDKVFTKNKNLNFDYNSKFIMMMEGTPISISSFEIDNLISSIEENIRMIEESIK